MKRKRKKLTRKEAEALFLEAKHAAQYMQYTSDMKWHWSEMTRSRIDHAKRTMTFSNPGQPSLVADVRYVGTFTTSSGVFQWAWQGLDEDEPIAKLRDFGDAHGLEELTEPQFVSTESRAWELTSLAAHLLGAESVCRSALPHGYVYVLLSNWRISARRTSRATRAPSHAAPRPSKRRPSPRS